jgi:CHAT domain-containing protein
VKSIAGLYGDGARVYVGEQATEGRVKAEARGARYLHFACHGFLDERLPLNSGLALTIPVPPVAGEDNGLLQAWEILEHVRLDADLVTLSACDSGLGKEMGGEGLIGLTRAFQYAGARSVVASLWSVYDRSTADLMRHFYGALRRGVPKDEALRRAQVALIQGGPQRSHPLSWAAFQLFGDWK